MIAWTADALETSDKFKSGYWEAFQEGRPAITNIVMGELCERTISLLRQTQKIMKLKALGLGTVKTVFRVREQYRQRKQELLRAQIRTERYCNQVPVVACALLCPDLMGHLNATFPNMSHDVAMA